MLRLLLIAVLCCGTMAQMIRQCTCGEVAPCKRNVKKGFMSCADKCQAHVAKLGANYNTVRSCIQRYERTIDAARNCEENQFANACSRGGGSMVQKRYPETLKLAFFTEINNMLARSGLKSQAKGFMASGKKFAACVMKCMERTEAKCFYKLGCGLNLPPDNVIVQTTKQCAISVGFNTPTVQSLCQCIAGAGVRGLAPLCSRISIY